jgi:cell fate regulator YaaT (PSP1 superfamily)
MKIIRVINENDLNVLRGNEEYIEKITPEIKEVIVKEDLELDLTYICFTYDRQKLYIYYTAETRVDFRNLIRVLGSRYKTRIQMVQIGVRDEVSIIGGMGICGREVCCKSFLGSLESVNVEMARNQCVSINPESVTGCCGRLLCCLRYENDYYESVARFFPKTGKKVTSPGGRGEVVDVNYLKGTVAVKLKSGFIQEYEVSEVHAGPVSNKIKKWIK